MISFSTFKTVALTWICYFSANILYVNNGSIKSTDGYYCVCSSDGGRAMIDHMRDEVYGYDSVFSSSGVGIDVDSIIRVKFKHIDKDSLVFWDSLNINK